ncbi:MAG: hypothetical protein M3461_03045 [Pseudomonadota bacterium]|nr:hypothetical protein [Pseudomonadota bacterium]
MIIYFYSPASLVLENAPISNDLAAYVFGKKSENQTIAFKSREEANKKNADLLNSAKHSIRIVTVHGASWLREQIIQPNFKRAMKTGRVELLVVNPLIL